MRQGEIYSHHYARLNALKPGQKADPVVEGEAMVADASFLAGGAKLVAIGDKCALWQLAVGDFVYCSVEYEYAESEE